MQRTNILSLQEVASVWIPYRIDAVRAAAWAMNLQTRVNGGATMNLSINKELRFSGYAIYFIEPMLEIGLVHARALLEFLGIHARNGKLVQISRRRPSDIGRRLKPKHGIARRDMFSHKYARLSCRVGTCRNYRTNQ
jgi:hypothetical protein